MRCNHDITVILLISLTLNSRITYQQDSTADELYSETPCELRSLSAFKDIQSNLWGIGDGNLWWFNSTNLSWSLLPLPNGTSLADPWRVGCGDSKRYVALISASSTLVLHLPWQHWQQVDTDDVSTGSIDSFATWCKSGLLYATDSLKNNIYILDHEEARWTLLSDTTGSDDINITHSVHTASNISRTWILPNGEFALAGSLDSCDHIMISNSSAPEWVMLKQRSLHDVWPDLNGNAITWVKEGNDSGLWLWVNNNNGTSIWSFDLKLLSWTDETKTSPQLPKGEDILISWVDRNQLCLLKRTEVCSAQYSSSATICWDNLEDKYNKLLEIPTDASTKEVLDSQPTTIPLRMVIPETPRPMVLSAHTVINKHSLLSALQSEIDGIDSSDDIPITAAVPSKHNPWHQHTSVFGSVIFFGTSLTIFGVVGSFWCIKRCVYFPKEALLLRDPPSVRYTAIPDNLPFDSRGHRSTAYTVIPDSIA